MNSNIHPALKFYRYHVWANRKVFGHLRSLPATVYRQEVRSVFPSLEVVLKHIYTTDLMWLEVMKNTPFQEIIAIVGQLKAKSADCDLAELEALYEEAAGLYEAFLAEQDLELNITVSHPQHGEGATTLAELLHHVVNHGTYHRGNITAMLRQQGCEGIPTDYIYYIYEE